MSKPRAICAVVLFVLLPAHVGGAEGREPPKLALPQVVVVGVDTLHVGGDKSELAAPRSMPLWFLDAPRGAAPPAVGSSAHAPGGKEHSFMLSAAGGGERTLVWRLGGEGLIARSGWAARASRSASHDRDWGLESWWREEVAATVGNSIRAGLTWQRLGYGAMDGRRRTVSAQPVVEWRRGVRARLTWSGGSVAEDSWHGQWRASAELPLAVGVGVRAEGQTEAGATLSVTGERRWGRWHLTGEVGALARDGGGNEWLAQGRALAKASETMSVRVAARRRALFHHPGSLLADCAYTREAPRAWSWAELREEAEAGLTVAVGPVNAEAVGAVWRSYRHPQWQSSTEVAQVDAEGAWATFSLGALWRGLVGEAEITRHFSDVAGQDRELLHHPLYRWSVRLGAGRGDVDLAAFAEGAGERPTLGDSLGSFALFGLEGRVSVGARLSFVIRGTNLLDEEYRLWSEYPLPGSRVVAGFDLRL